MLTRLGVRALSALGYKSNEELPESMDTELDDSKLTNDGWVFIRQKRPQRSCTKQDSKQTDEWLTVTSSRTEAKTRLSENGLNIDYDTMDDIDEEDTAPTTKSNKTIKSDTKTNKKLQDAKPLFRENRSEVLEGVDTVLTRNQRRLIRAAKESKAILDQGVKTKRLQNTSFPVKFSRKQAEQHNRMTSQNENRKRGRKRHMMASTYSGKNGRRGS